MMWLKVYGSEICCELLELATTPDQSQISPHVQIGTRPMASNIIAVEPMTNIVRRIARRVNIGGIDTTQLYAACTLL